MPMRSGHGEQCPQPNTVSRRDGHDYNVIVADIRLLLHAVCDSTLSDSMIAAQTAVLNAKYAPAQISFLQASVVRCSSSQQSTWKSQCGSTSSNQWDCTGYFSTLSSATPHSGILLITGQVSSSVGLLG